MGAVLLSPLYILLNVYLAGRLLLWFSTLHSVLGSLWFAVPFTVLYILIALSPLTAAFGRGRLKTVSRVVSNYWFGTLLYLLGLLLLFDLGRVLLLLARRESPFSPIGRDTYRISGAVMITAVALLSAYGISHAARVRKTHYDVTVRKALSGAAPAPAPANDSPHTQNAKATCTASPYEKNADAACTAAPYEKNADTACTAAPANHSPHTENTRTTLRIALAADLHLGGSIGVGHVRQLKRLIDRMQPDLIVFAGDIFDNDFDAIAQPDKIAALLKDMKSTYGSFACWGNHDIDEVILAGFTFDSGSAAASDPRMDRLLADADIRLLADQTLLVDNSFYLIGRLDASCRKKSGTVRRTAAELTAPLNHCRPILVIDHQPSDLDALAAAGADLVLSGHTHDGQLFPGNLTTRIGWKNSCGKLELGTMTSIVTSGVGVWGPAMRIGTKSEVVEIDVTFTDGASD